MLFWPRVQRFDSVSTVIIPLFWRDEAVLNSHASCFYEFLKFKSRWTFLFERIGKAARRSLFVFQLWGHLFSHSCQANLLLTPSVCGWCCHLISPQLLHIQQNPGNSFCPFLLARHLLDTLAWCVGWCWICPERKLSVWCFHPLTALLLLVTLTICISFLLSVQN